MVMGVPRQNMEKCPEFTEINRKIFFLRISFENKIRKKLKMIFGQFSKISKLNQISEFQSYYI